MTQISSKQKYEGHCAKCYYFLHPDKWVPSVRYKTKELRLYHHLTTLFGKGVFTWDKRVSGGCSRRRPDFLFDCLTHAVVVECDENQHQDVWYRCDNKRMMEIFQDLGSRPVVFILFNPDEYIDSSGMSRPSCFGKKGKIDQDSWSDRLVRVVGEIKYAMANIPDKEMTIIKLFYTERSS